jgi:hypothetical protein
MTDVVVPLPKHLRGELYEKTGEGAGAELREAKNMNRG